MKALRRCLVEGRLRVVACTGGLTRDHSRLEPDGIGIPVRVC